jgi:copper chaperone CopZ
MLTMQNASATRIARLRVHGLGYGPAVETIAMTLAEVPGVRSAKVNAATSTAHVECHVDVGAGDLLEVLGVIGFRGEVVPES